MAQMDKRQVESKQGWWEEGMRERRQKGEEKTIKVLHQKERKNRYVFPASR
jgi:hypothetical protein